MTSHQQLIRSIDKLKKERNAIILAHVYQRGEIQDIADFVGDSLDLSRKAVSTRAQVIVFCGVQFMAETAAILNPYKKVLIPDDHAGCGLADMATEQEISLFKKQEPRIGVVSYVNSSALVKSVSDICCTSANAVRVVNQLACNEVLFVPDRNLGAYVAEHTHKKIRLWNGFCYAHENIKVETVQQLKQEHPNAVIIVHPECTTPVRRLADFTGSTSQMSQYVKQSAATAFIVGTEYNFTYRLKADNPEKQFYPVNAVCEGMNAITLEKVLISLETMEYRLQIPEPVREKAEMALDKMLAVL